MLQAFAEELTLPDPLSSSGTYPAATPADAPMRFVASSAELRTRVLRRYAAVALHEAPPSSLPEDHERRLLILVLWSRLPSVVISPGKYRIVQPSENESRLPVHVAAYLTRGNAWRCLEAVRAGDGRIVLSGIDKKQAQGAFDVVFPSARFHGTFLAERPVRTWPNA
jgi:hypothetical protein